MGNRFNSELNYVPMSEERVVAKLIRNRSV